MKDAVSKYGRPKILNFDNSKSYKNKQYKSIDELRISLMDYVNKYNQNIHSSLNGLSPRDRFFKESHIIKRLTDIDFSSGIKSLVKLGYNLYNRWSDDSTTPIKLLGSLDEDNLKLADMAMKIRFNHAMLKELQKEILD